MMKTYNIIEALNMPVGTEFEVKDNSNNMIVKKAGTGEIATKSLFWKEDDIQVEVDNYVSELKLTKVRKKVTLLEAMAQIKQGKKMTNSFLHDDLLFKNDYYFMNEKGELDCTYGALYFNSQEYSADWYEFEEKQC